MHRTLRSLALISLVAGSTHALLADIGDFRVNTLTTGDQAAPAIAADLAGDFVVVWVDVTDGSSTSIQGRRFAAAGFASPQGAEFRVNTTTTGGQDSPSVARDSTGAFVVAWSAFQDGSQRSVHARRYDAAGAPVGLEFRVNTYTAGNQSAPVVGASPAGTFVVVWFSATTADPTGGIFLQRYDAAGNPQGVESRVNTSTTDVQQEPAVAVSSTGSFVVVWSSLAAGAGIRGQRFSAAGAPVGGEFGIGGTSGVSARPSVATDLTGSFVVAWESSPDFADDVFARRFSSTGAPLGAETRVNTFTTGIQEDASVTVYPSGDFVIAWTGLYGQDGAGSAVLSQRFAAGGEPIGAETRVNGHTQNDQNQPAVAPGANGGFLAVWTSRDQDAPLSSGVYGREELPGEAVDAQDFRVNTFTTQDQQEGRIAMDPSGSYVVVWTSFIEDGSGNGVFGQCFESAGAPFGTEFRVNQTTAGHQLGYGVAMLPGGGFAVTWENLATGTGDVMLRLFDEACAPVEDEFRVNTTTTGSQLSPGIASSSTGFVVVWIDSQAGTDSVLGRRFDAAGTLSGSEFRIDSFSTGQKTVPSVGMDASGGFVVVWETFGEVPGGETDVFMQRFSNAGDRLGGELRVNTATTLIQSHGHVAISPTGEFVVTWGSQSDTAIEGQRFGPDGKPRGAEFRVATSGGGYESATVGAGPHGEFVVAWPDDFLNDVFAQRYGRSGASIGAAFRVSTTSTPSSFPGALALDALGRPVVVYATYGEDGSRFGVYRRRFAALVSGDANGDGAVDLVDVFYLINTLFAGGPPAASEVDVNADGTVDVSDIFYLINFLFAGGPKPL
jgi:hypothetical protein